jgi:nitroimidazol reductase NimA-like FMN-containing flavoprotein (pyridoxamine 5'-phosphate oxidase superfamily)
MRDNSLIQEVKTLLESQRLAVLATNRGGHPYTNLIAFVNTDDLLKLLFITRRDKVKYKNIETDPRTSVQIDNRKNSPDDLNNAKTVTAIGRSNEVPKNKKNYLKIFIKKHPYLEDFAKDSKSALIAIDVESYIYVSRFKNVRVIKKEDLLTDHED